ncbi:hypothetical protein GS502_11010 [Rhodococcus hoagii]|nr:hypothetical protein [Prescottella equi]
MAREHAPLRLDIMGDDDFRDLTPAAQHLYFLLLIDAKLSYCGVTDWRPKRIAARAKGWTPEDVVAAARELAEGLFVVVDEAVEEVLVRSFIKHDGLMKNPRMAVSMMLAYAGVESKELRGVVVFEVAKLRANQPDLACWESKYSGEKLRQLLRRESIDPADYPTGFRAVSPEVSGSVNPEVSGSVSPEVNPQVKGSVYPKPTPNVYPKVYGSTSPAPTPAPTPTTSNEVVEKTCSTASSVSEPIDAEVVDEDGYAYPADLLQPTEPAPTAKAAAEPAGFADWYAAYPRKVARKAAAKAYANARKTHTGAQLLLAVRRYAADPNLPEKKFIPHPSTWLNEGRWDDEPEAAPVVLQSRRERQFAEAGDRIAAAVAGGAPNPLALIDAVLSGDQQAIGGVA